LAVDLNVYQNIASYDPEITWPVDKDFGSRSQCMNTLGLGRYIGVSVHRDIFSDDLRIDTPTQISILPFKKNQNNKNILCLQPKVKVIVLVVW
jgi:hypothetical protein